MFSRCLFVVEFLVNYCTTGQEAEISITALDANASVHDCHLLHENICLITTAKVWRCFPCHGIVQLSIIPTITLASSFLCSKIIRKSRLSQSSLLPPILENECYDTFVFQIGYLIVPQVSMKANTHKYMICIVWSGIALHPFLRSDDMIRHKLVFSKISKGLSRAMNCYCEH